MLLFVRQRGKNASQGREIALQRYPLVAPSTRRFDKSQRSLRSTTERDRRLVCAGAGVIGLVEESELISLDSWYSCVHEQLYPRRFLKEAWMIFSWERENGALVRRLRHCCVDRLTCFLQL